MEVAKGVHRLGSKIVNWYLIEDGARLALVDAATPKDWASLLRIVGSLGRTLDDVEVVLLTHAHADHIGFAERARTDAHAVVRVHDADAAVARGEIKATKERGAGLDVLRPAAIGMLAYFLRMGALKPPRVTVVSTFADGETLDSPGRPLVVHSPGHTAGHCALLLPDRDVLISGDAIVTRNVFTGREGPQISPAAFNENSARALESLSLLEGIEAGLMLPGHGEPWTGGVAEAVALARRAGVR